MHSHGLLFLPLGCDCSRVLNFRSFFWTAGLEFLFLDSLPEIPALGSLVWDAWFWNAFLILDWILGFGFIVLDLQFRALVSSLALRLSHQMFFDIL